MKSDDWLAILTLHHDFQDARSKCPHHRFVLDLNGTLSAGAAVCNQQTAIVFREEFREAFGQIIKVLF